MIKTFFNGMKGVALMIIILCMMSFKPIQTVERIEVETPVGTAPRLPFQVWVTYTDGSHEWRQVRWTNSSLAREQQEANAVETLVGTEYKVVGFITGDNTTDKGYPVVAHVRVVSTAWEPPDAQP